MIDPKEVIDEMKSMVEREEDEDGTVWPEQIAELWWELMGWLKAASEE